MKSLIPKAGKQYERVRRLDDKTIEFITKRIGKRIKKYRKLKNITQSDLSQKVNISRPHIANIENGYSKTTIETLLRISYFLDISIEQLFSDQKRGE